MRKAFAAALGAAIVGGLALAALSGGATARVSSATLDDGSARGVSLAGAQYKGAFKDAGPATEIEIKAKLRNGEATEIKRMVYEGLPATCPETGFDQITGGWTLAGVTVNDKRKFKAIGNDGEPPGMRSSLRFTGKFNRSFNKVRGKFQTSAYFPASTDPKLPEETCVSETKRYVANR